MTYQHIISRHVCRHYVAHATRVEIPKWNPESGPRYVPEDGAFYALESTGSRVVERPVGLGSLGFWGVGSRVCKVKIIRFRL